MKLGKKYIIEIIEKPFKDDAGREVWRAKGFNTLYFDQNGLDKLEEYNEPEAHKFKVGDVCKLEHLKGELIISRITPDCISYMWDDGTYGMNRRSFFEHQAKFVRHSNYFETFLAGGLK